MPRTSPTTRKGHPPDKDPPTEQRDPTRGGQAHMERTTPEGGSTPTRKLGN